MQDNVDISTLVSSESIGISWRSPTSIWVLIMSLMVTNLEFGEAWTFLLFLGCNCTNLLSNCLIFISCYIITKSFWSIPFAIFRKSTLVVDWLSVPSPVIWLTCWRISRLFWGVWNLIVELESCHSGTWTSLNFLRASSSSLLLFSNNNLFIRGFAIRIGHNPDADHPALMFSGVKASVRAFL